MAAYPAPHINAAPGGLGQAVSRPGSRSVPQLSQNDTGNTRNQPKYPGIQEYTGFRDGMTAS